jgi:hypothetical protein
VKERIAAATDEFAKNIRISRKIIGVAAGIRHSRPKLSSSADRKSGVGVSLRARNFTGKR